eukprot:g81461.t1
MSRKSEGEPALKRSKREKQSGSPPGEGKADYPPWTARVLVTLLWLLVAFFGPGAVIFLCAFVIADFLLTFCVTDVFPSVNS